MTRYKLLKLIRRLLGLHLPGWQNDYMPRTGNGYTELYVFVNGREYWRVEVKIERLG